METTLQQRLSDGYAQSERAARIPNFKRERDELAKMFKPVPSLESMLTLREREPQAFRQLNIAGLRMQLASYEKARHAFHKTGQYSDEALDVLRDGIEREKYAA
jgi:uncharacterized protein YydD (DUF2326 family)